MVSIGNFYGSSDQVSSPTREIRRGDWADDGYCYNFSDGVRAGRKMHCAICDLAKFIEKEIMLKLVAACCSAAYERHCNRRKRRTVPSVLF